MKSIARRRTILISALATPAIARASLPLSRRAFLRFTQGVASTILQLETRESAERKREFSVVNVKRARRMTLCRVVFCALHSRPGFRIIRHFLPAASHTADIKIQLPLEKGRNAIAASPIQPGRKLADFQIEGTNTQPATDSLPNPFPRFFPSIRAQSPVCNMGCPKSSMPVCSLHGCI